MTWVPAGSRLTHTRQLVQVFKEKEKNRGLLGRAAENMVEGSFLFRAGGVGGGIFLLFWLQSKSRSRVQSFWVMAIFVGKHWGLGDSLFGEKELHRCCSGCCPPSFPGISCLKTPFCAPACGERWGMSAMGEPPLLQLMQ